MDITWLGHACVRVRTRTATVVMDPADRSAGFDMGRPTAQIVTISHQHPAHDHAAGVRGSPLVIDGPGEYELSGVQLFGVAAQMPANDGEPPLRNIAYLVQAEGLHVAHLGGLAVAPTAEEAELLSNVDILIVPLGGERDVQPETAARTVRDLEPAIAIPVAFTPTADGKPAKGSPLALFIEAVGLEVDEPEARLSIQRRAVGEGQRIVLLEPSRG